MFKDVLKNIGPGPLVAAAFIGPGTVTLCTLAGVQFGYALLWAMALSVFACIVLQEMAARLGIITQKGLSEIIRSEIGHPVLKILALVLILSAIVIGNAAYEAGNISGGVLGLETVIDNPAIHIGGLQVNTLSLLIGGLAFILLYMGNYRILERVMVSLVILMSIAFIITAVLTRPVMIDIVKNVLVPKLPENSIFTVIGLIGTTVVPYNLFLHASLVSEKWQDGSDLKYARKDTIIAVIVGGIVSMCIIIAASAIQNPEINNASDLAQGLEPLFGNYATYFLSAGLFAAGITSAITAPLAGAYVASGCLGWTSNLRSRNFRAVWMFILILGVFLSSLDIKPIEIIKFAQVANGLLLPVIAGFLIWIVNKRSILGTYRNNTKQNVFGFIILIISVLLSIAAFNNVLN
jgi:NRAMP (natural resistance-associated macrophage protein)-like metal ion transporter